MYYIIVKNQFTGEHRYLNAPAEVSFLQNWHRHVFYVRTTIEANHSNRQVEFFMVQKRIDQFLRSRYEGRQFEQSCEQIAESVFDFVSGLGLVCTRVEVSEDDENVGVFIKK